MEVGGGSLAVHLPRALTLPWAVVISTAPKSPSIPTQGTSVLSPISETSRLKQG